MTDEEIKTALAGTAHLVEATDYETLALWREWHERLSVEWRQLPTGFWAQVGRAGRMPVVVSLHGAIVQGRKIMFYEATSLVVDQRMVDKWLAKHLPGVPKTNAMNFHHAMDCSALQHGRDG